jgi:hypothetical protein
MAQYLSNRIGIFDTGDDSILATAFWAGEHVDAEDSAHQFSPE